MSQYYLKVSLVDGKLEEKPLILNASDSSWMGDLFEQIGPKQLDGCVAVHLASRKRSGQYVYMSDDTLVPKTTNSDGVIPGLDIIAVLVREHREEDKDKENWLIKWMGPSSRQWRTELIASFYDTKRDPVVKQYRYFIERARRDVKTFVQRAELYKSLLKSPDQTEKVKAMILEDEKDIYRVMDLSGATILHMTVQQRNVEICRFLLQRKRIHRYLMDAKGCMACDYAAKSTEILKLLWEPHPHHEAIHTNALHSYFYWRYGYWLKHLNWLVQQGCDDFNDTELDVEITKLYEEHGVQAVALKVEAMSETFLSYPTEKDGKYADRRFCLACEARLAGLKRCSRCKEVWFCNIKCQRNASLIHRIYCDKVKM